MCGENDEEVGAELVKYAPFLLAQGLTVLGEAQCKGNLSMYLGKPVLGLTVS
jgi:hypothetical protein